MALLRPTGLPRFGGKIPLILYRIPTATYTYTYGDSSWGDLLTAYNGISITYDEIGNPLNDGTWTYMRYADQQKNTPVLI